MAIIVALSNRKIREIGWLTCACKSLTNFQYEADAITGNGRIFATIVAPSQVVNSKKPPKMRFQKSREVDSFYLCLQQFDKFSI
jgi:hypothetical protein